MKGLIALSFDTRGYLISPRALPTRDADRAPDLADLCLVRMSKLFAKHSVTAIDRRTWGPIGAMAWGDSVPPSAGAL